MPESRGMGYYPTDPGRDVRKLRQQIEVVLSKGLLDGRMTELDMSQLPPALR